MHIKKHLIKVIILGILVLFAFGCKTTEDKKKIQDPQIVSYMRTWGMGSEVAEINKGNYWVAEDVNGEKMTVLNIAFATIINDEETGQPTDIHIPNLKVIPREDGTETPPFENLFEEIAKIQAASPELRINLSIGGWGADGFSDMAFTAENREAFVATVLEWVKEYKFDGVDIDWEYPVSGAWGTIKGQPEDKENFTLLMALLKSELNKLEKETGKEYEISFAAGASPAYLTWIEPEKVAEIIDYIKLMTYDFYGSWSSTTGHLANLYDSPGMAEGDLSLEAVVNNYLEAGFPAEKMLLGVPFYGRGWKGVGSENNGLYQAYGESIYADGITYPDIQKLMAEDSSFVRYWDDAAKAPYLYNGDVFITYEDEQSLREKAKFIKAKGLRGFMIWEYAHDMNNELIDVINDELK